MRLRHYIAASLLVCGAVMAQAVTPPDYTWSSMSRNSSESMPVGGGDIGLNVWAEDGDVLFYIGRSGAYDENNTLLKLGRVRMRIPGDTLKPFSQTLHLNEGYATVDINGARVTLWADVNKPVVHVTVDSPEAIQPEIVYENWRYVDRPFRKGEGRQSSWKWSSDKSLTTTRDSVLATDGSVTFYHLNPEVTVFDTTVKKESLDPVKDQIWNPLALRMSGGRMSVPGFSYTGAEKGVYDSTDYMGYHFKADRPRRSHHFTIALNNTEGGDETAWRAGLDAAEKSVNVKRDLKASRDWWRDYWQRSYIHAEGDSVTSRMARNYTLFRYMLGCNAYGEEPTKFNGGLFTFDPEYVNAEMAYTPDYRNWGGGTMTAQNQRLVYWPMLKSGDFDMMKPQFDFYLRMLPAAMLRSRYYWDHDGACFTEQIEQYGLPNHMEYGSKRPAGYDPGVEYNAWLEYEWDTVLEFCAMMLEASRYDGTDISAYRPLIEQSLIFFDEHYRKLASERGIKSLDGDGCLILFPGSGCETYKMANNAASTVAALKRVTGEYIDYLKEQGDTATNRWEQLLSRVPAIPLRNVDGYTMIAPAKSWERVNNVESPQLYPVWPWRFFDAAHADSASLAIARNTYFHDPDALKFRSTTGWKQDNIWAACLALPEEAYKLNSGKLADGKHRFPAFFGPGFDWTPDHNWGGSGMIGLQEMLLQTAGDRIMIFPAWPLDRDISFKLHAPGNTVVEAAVKDGRLVDLNVSPVSRRDDVVLPAGLTFDTLTH